VDICQGHEIGFEGGEVGLLEAWEREWAGNELARGRVGGFGRLVRVERTAVVLGRTELVSGGQVSECSPVFEQALSRHTCLMAEFPRSCASGATGRIWCLALKASRNRSPQGPGSRVRLGSRSMHSGGTAGLRFLIVRCFERALASGMTL
jgi:hypothetical protein